MSVIKQNGVRNMLKIKAFDNMSAQDVESRLDEISKGPGGLEKMAALGLQPLQEDVLYESRVRQIFAEYTLSPGEEAVFDGDVRVPGVALSVEGLPYQVEVKSNRTRIDTAPITAKAMVRWNESNYRKFDMLDWVQARAKSALLEQEDLRGITVLDAASELYHTAISSTGKLLVDKIAEAAATVADAIRTPAVRLVMSAKRAADLAVLQSTTGASIGNLFVPAMQEEILRKGVIGSILGLEIVTIPKRQDGTSIIDESSVYVCGPAELVGVIAIRSEITPRTQVSVKDNSDLIAFWEDLGFYCKYSKAICKIKIV